MVKDVALLEALLQRHVDGGADPLSGQPPAGGATGGWPAPAVPGAPARGADLPADVPAELRPMLLAARALHAAAAPVAMPDEARTELRLSLLRQAQGRRATPPSLLTRMRERTTAKVEGWAYSARLAGVGGLAATVLSGGGVAVATESALPGDLLYSLKLAVEDVALLARADGAPRGDALLEQALDRIDEASRAIVAAEGDEVRMGPAATALRLADEDAREGAQELLTAYIDTGEAELLTDLGDWVVATGRRLDLLPPPTGDAALALQELRTSLIRIGQRVELLATGACTTCDLGPHDDAAAQGLARGLELDGTPPLPPSGPFDITEIPRADQPFQACACVPATPRRPAANLPTPAPASAPAAPPAAGAPPADPAPAPAGGSGPGGSGSGGGGSGGGGGGGGGGVPVPRPDPGPVTDPLPAPVGDPVRQAVEEVLEALPETIGTP
jgi:hypothetical protein